MDLTQEQWNVVAPLLPADPVRKDRRGRPRSDRQQVLNGVLWILRTGAPWKDLPARCQFAGENQPPLRGRVVPKFPEWEGRGDESTQSESANSIVSLFAQGWSKRRIARELALDRVTGTSKPATNGRFKTSQSEVGV